MPGKKASKSTAQLAREVAQLKKQMKENKPETKTVDVLSVSGSGDPITIQGPYNGVTNAPYDLTGLFVQGVQNQGQIEGNYCKINQIDLRILLQNVNHPSNYAKIRLMLVRVPSAQNLTYVDILREVLEFGDPSLYNQKSYVSPYKRNSSINGGYDVMMDKVITLSSAVATYAPQNASKYIRKTFKFKNGLDLRFSGVAGSLALEQNRIYLFAFDGDVAPTGTGGACNISFISRIKYSDE